MKQVDTRIEVGAGWESRLRKPSARLRTDIDR
jgi:hypothetical protein